MGTDTAPDRLAGRSSPAVKDVMGALGGSATKVFEIRDCSQRAADDRDD